ncbi:hypothetical protein QTP86_027163 [Hemibagrus guttatus]|nr:hypothetical protein QTP86_027163 [Hemibagrus guttatus]
MVFMCTALSPQCRPMPVARRGVYKSGERGSGSVARRGGVHARLKANPIRPALPSILLSNVCSLDYKLDYIRLERTTWCEYRDCCIFVFTETWLSDRVPDATIQLDRLTMFGADRNAALCREDSRRWLMYLHKRGMVQEICASLMLKRLCVSSFGAISKLQNAHPDGLFIIAGDFNHANLKSVLPKFHQHVDFATRGVNMLDLVYANIPGRSTWSPAPTLATQTTSLLC